MYAWSLYQAREKSFAERKIFSFRCFFTFRNQAPFFTEREFGIMIYPWADSLYTIAASRLHNPTDRKS